MKDELALWARRLCTNYNQDRSEELLKEFIVEYEKIKKGYEQRN